MKHGKLVVIVLFLAALMLGYFYYLSNTRDTAATEVEAKATKVQEVIMKNLNDWYPPTPKEVIRFYAEISQCYYNESYTEEELIEMARQMQRLFDIELLEINSPFESYLEGLKLDIEAFAEKSYTITNFAISDSTDVEKYVDDGYEWARLHCIYYIRDGTRTSMPNDHVYLLRKDADGHWKIFGWIIKENEAEDNGEEL